jgi:HSP20 family protein
MKPKKKDELVPVGFDWPRGKRMDVFPAFFDDGFPAIRMPIVRAAIPALVQPVIDVFDAGKEMVVTAEIPGTKKEDIGVKVTPQGLNLTVRQREKKEERHEDKRRGVYSYSASSRFEGYSRFVPFGAQVDSKAAKATYKNGVLELRVPKRGKPDARQVKVE